MRNILKKTAIATALSAAMMATTASAASLVFSSGEGTVVLANVIFGEGNPGTGSEETLITAPESSFILSDPTNFNVGDVGTTASIATVKYTLGGAAIFGEDLSTTALIDAANGGVGAFGLNTNVGVVTYDVVQGGAIGDNTITLELTFANNGDELDSVTLAGYKVKNLTSALKASSGDPRVRLGVEYTESIDNTLDDINGTATDLPLVIFGSAEPLSLTGTTVDFNTPNFIRINVGSGESTFTAGTTDGRSDFDAAGDVTFVTLGTLQLQRQTIDTAVDFPAANAGLIKKENGNDFDFQGGDNQALSFAAASGSFQIGALIFLSDINCAATAPAIANLNNTSAVVAADGSVNLAINGTTTALTTAYNLCYSVAGTIASTVIPEVAGISAAWNVVFFNSRYDNRQLAFGAYGPLLRNGCIASFFNIPASDNASDTAFVRLTNTSTTNAGDIRGTLWAQDGSIIGTADTTVAPTLAIHATQIFSSNAADIPFAGGNIISIENAFGVTPTDFGTGGSRARLVLKGAFDTCEGLGLLRTSGGSLFNMTATTMGNEAGGANDGNNAQ